MSQEMIPEGAIRVFKYVTEDFKSPGGFGVIDYSGPYPQTIIEPDCDPPEKRQCGKGIHVVPMADNIDWHNVIASYRIICGYVMPEDVIFSETNPHEGNGKMRAKQFTVTHIPTREEIIPFILQDSRKALSYALHIDKAPSDDTREIACLDPMYAYEYALYVDKQPRDDTRKAAFSRANTYLIVYALHVDKQPRDDSRTQACKSSVGAFNYAHHIDCGPTDETRTAACKIHVAAREYACEVDQAPHPETWACVKNTLSEKSYLQFFKTTALELDLQFAPKT